MENTVTTIACSNDVYQIMAPVFADMMHEEVWLITLNRVGGIISKTMMYKGGRYQSTADPALIFKEAILSTACSIILCHNHPSGRALPSLDDNSLTDRIAKVGKLLDIRLFDHLIIGGDSYYSYADEMRLG
jgi:DNA repair protein RadC